MTTGITVTVANTTAGLITLQYRSPRTKRVVKYKCMPGETKEIKESHFTVLKKNKVVAAMLKAKKIVVGKNATPQPNLPEGFEEAEDEILEGEAEAEAEGEGEGEGEGEDEGVE